MSPPAWLRGLAFAAPGGSTWGAALGGEQSALVVGSSAGAAGLAGLRLREDGGDWRLEGDGVALSARPQGPAIAGAALCHIEGSAGELAVDCPGVWVELPAARAERHAPASARLIGGLFTDASGLALLAARPSGAVHQDADETAAALFDPDEWLAVHDPRLSTTYDDAGVPTRTSLELWVGEGEEELPRRAAGEAAGPGGAVALADGRLRVVPLRCHSRGEDGAGVYALATL